MALINGPYELGCISSACGLEEDFSPLVGILMNPVKIEFGWTNNK